MKYLRKFATEADVLMTAKPNVVLVGDTSKVIYNQYGGVYIQHIDGRLFTTEAWSAEGFSNDEANGVAVLADEASFVIAKEDCSSDTLLWGGYNVLINGIVTSTASGVASLDYNGESNTYKIIERLNGYSDSYSSGAPAAEACAAYVFPNGQHGYLPALGELQISLRYFYEITKALNIVGSPFKTGTAQYWSSTQYNKGYSWRLSYAEEKITYIIKVNSSQLARAFAPLNL